MSFRILNQAPQYLLADGSVNAGGKLFFYETDLTTPKNTWSNEALTVLNSNPVVMDAAGRTLTDVWGDDSEYGVKMTDAADVVIWTRNNVRASEAAALTIPALVDGQFLTNNGSVLLWAPVLQVPDPSGHADDILFSDGSLAFWGPAPAAPVVPDPEVVITGNGAAGSFQAGTSASTTKYYRQWGQGTAPANAGAKTTSLAVVFPVAFVDTPRIFITMRGSGFTNVGSYPDFGLSADSNTGFTVKFDSQRGESNSDMNISSAIPFSWTAEGTRLVP